MCYINSYIKLARDVINHVLLSFPLLEVALPAIIDCYASSMIYMWMCMFVSMHVCVCVRMHIRYTYMCVYDVMYICAYVYI